MEKLVHIIGLSPLFCRDIHESQVPLIALDQHPNDRMSESPKIEMNFMAGLPKSVQTLLDLEQY